MVHFLFLIFGSMQVTFLLIQLKKKKKKKVERWSVIIGAWVEDFQGKVVIYGVDRAKSKGAGVNHVLKWRGRFWGLNHVNWRKAEKEIEGEGYRIRKKRVEKSVVLDWVEILKMGCLVVNERVVSC